MGALLLNSMLMAETWACGSPSWEYWQTFRDHFVTQDGRVIDPIDPAKMITTSEGQSYALFFSLAANDQETFAKMATWTENNLSAGHFEQHLPGWLWGHMADGSWGLMDDNSATDADLWIAYSLAEAARLWNVPEYLVKSEELQHQILSKESVGVEGLGNELIPGAVGFHSSDHVWRFNPSYLPPQVLRYFSSNYPGSAWVNLEKNSLQLLETVSPFGLAPDWVEFDTKKQAFTADTTTGDQGSYNAIRVYLWVGMLPRNDPQWASLQDHFSAIARFISPDGNVPEVTYPLKGTVTGNGPVGFSSAVVPLLQAEGKEATLEILKFQNLVTPSVSNSYYNWVLTLFAEGFNNGIFSFSKTGSLIPDWSCVSH
ncbi:MAG: cellulase [Ferrovum sp.]|nr:cellulase [Ferrovum sp.]NDU87585.1 cellulase [Ferrovum sp.]